MLRTKSFTNPQTRILWLLWEKTRKSQVTERHSSFQMYWLNYHSSSVKPLPHAFYAPDSILLPDPAHGNGEQNTEWVSRVWRPTWHTLGHFEGRKKWPWQAAVYKLRDDRIEHSHVYTTRQKILVPVCINVVTARILSWRDRSPLLCTQLPSLIIRFHCASSPKCLTKANK